MKAEYLKLGAFDIDGTVYSKDLRRMEPEVKQGLISLQEQGVLTTFATGKNRTRIVDVLGDTYGQYVSAPLVLENGGLITLPTGGRIDFNPLHSDAIKMVMDTALKHSVGFLLYYPPSEANPVLWTNSPEAQSAITGGTREQFTTTHSEAAFYNESQKDIPVMLVTENNQSLIADLRKIPDINITENEDVVNINAGGINKRTGVERVCEVLHIGKESVLVAGNDKNDIPLFHGKFGMSIKVGDRLDESVPATFRVAAPKDLGVFLQSIRT